MNPIHRAGLTLGTCVLVAIVALSATHHLTKKRIASTQHQWLTNNLASILPNGPFDNDPLLSAHNINAPSLGSDKPLTVYPVYKDEKPLAAVLTVIAPNGYNGQITLLLGVSVNGTIIGARVTNHNETPGLGDDIELKRSEWIHSFSNKSLSNTTSLYWNVRKDNGTFDAFTGATITPRAVIHAVYRALKWFENNQDRVFD